jgi:hypothetical protein
MEIANNVKRGKLSPKVNWNGFNDAFNNLPHKYILIVRRELQKKLGWSPRTFSYKRSGEYPLRENEVPVIQEIFARFGLNSWTGERI